MTSWLPPFCTAYPTPHSTYYWLASLIVTVQLQLETLRDVLEITWVSPDGAVTQRLDIRDYPTVTWCCCHKEILWPLSCKLNTALVDIVFTELWDDLCESLEHGFDEPRVCSFLHTLCSLPAPFDRLSFFTLYKYFFNFSTNKVIRKYLPPTTYTSLVFYTHDRLITNLSITNTLLCYYNIDQLIVYKLSPCRKQIHLYWRDF